MPCSAYPAEAGEHIAVIKGTVPMLVVKELGRFTFHHPLEIHKPVSVAVGANKLILSAVTADANDGYHCDFKLVRGDETSRRIGRGVTEHPMGSFFAYAAMVGPKGEKVYHGGNSHWSKTEMDCQFHFSRNDAEGATDLRIDLPVKISRR